MRITLYAHFLICLLTILGILLCNDIRSQTGDTISTIKLPLPHEDLSLFDSAELDQHVIERTAAVVEEKTEVQRQKRKSDESLLNILPSGVAEELKEKGYTTAKSFVEVTVLFSDIKGFTNIAEKLKPKNKGEMDMYFVE